MAMAYGLLCRSCGGDWRRAARRSRRSPLQEVTAAIRYDSVLFSTVPLRLCLVCVGRTWRGSLHGSTWRASKFSEQPHVAELGYIWITSTPSVKKKSTAPFSFIQNLNFFAQYPSHRILRHMHGVLNVDGKKTNCTVGWEIARRNFQT